MKCLAIAGCRISASCTGAEVPPEVIPAPPEVIPAPPEVNPAPLEAIPVPPAI